MNIINPYRFPSQIGILVYKNTDDQGGNYYGVDGDGTFIYTTADINGLYSYSVDGSGNLTFIDSDDQGDNYYGVYSDGTYIYTACGAGGLRAYSVDGSGILTFVDGDDQGGTYYGVSGDGNYIYVGTSLGLLSYSFNGSILTHIDTENTKTAFAYSQCIYCDGTYIYGAGGLSGDGLYVYSVDISGNLTYIDADKYSLNAYYGVFGDGTYIYACCSNDGIISYSFDGATLTLLDIYENVTYPGPYIGGNMHKGYVIIGSNSNDVLSLSVDVSANFTFIDQDKQGTGPCYSIYEDGNYIYVTSYSEGLRVYALTS